MAKKTLKDLNTKTKPKTFTCSKCRMTYDGNSFYSFPTFPGQILPVCKECLYAFCINAHGLSRDGMVQLMKYINLPFFQNYYEEVASKNLSDKWKVSQYFTKLRSHNGIEDLSFKDSIFEIIEDFNEIETEVVDLSEGFEPNDLGNEEEQITKTRRSTKQRLAELQAKWGKFTSIDYMERCEELYQEIVQGGYIIRSSMHDISVRNYCKLQVDWDIAQETKDYNAMKELKQPLKDARTDAKLNPSQLKAEDFSTGGANSFSEISRVVAQKHGFIPLPMKYYKQPNDALDFLAWELINYMRHCLSMPEVEYEEVYKFHIDKINEFNEKYQADIEQGMLGTLDEETKDKRREWRMI